MAIDPVRLARIRMRLVAAAATLVVPACGGNGQPNINEPAIDPPHKQFDGPINDRVKEPPNVSPKPEPTTNPPPEKEEIHINTPAPQAHLGGAPGDPDTGTRVRSPQDLPPPGQTINTAPVAAPSDLHINTPPPQPKHHVNPPPPPLQQPDTTIINTPKPN